MRVTPATEPQIEAALQGLPYWTRHGSSIVRKFTFKDFSEAWAFMSRVALLAERKDHHPDWHNVWNRVEITLSTHDAGGLSQRDFDFAKAVDQLL